MMIISSLALIAAMMLTHSQPRARLDIAGTTVDDGPHPRDGPVTRRIAAISRACRRATQPHPYDIAGDVDLFAACIEAGLSTAHAAATVAHATDRAEWHYTASLLALGLEPEKAWHVLAQRYNIHELAALAHNAYRSGAALAAGCHTVADRVREQGNDHATAQAERASVFIALPLTLCYLPAFLLLGIVPVVIDVGSTIISTH